jgi:adenylosuccinate synthase
VVINPSELVVELDRVIARSAKVNPERFWISARAHVITPWHIHLDGVSESKTTQPIGTTKRGIGPTYADKASRTGLRMGHYVQVKSCQAWLDRMLENAPGFREFYQNTQDQWQRFLGAAARLAPFVCDSESRIRHAAQSGKKLLVEGAQGTLLDIDHGTYPYVTASSTGTGGAVASIGLAPRLVSQAIGVAKGYVTRVGEGPFPTELKDDIGKQIAQRGQEFGATTGRPRRVGWLDAVALRYVVDVSGLDAVILNKLDVLTGLKEIKVATAYHHPEKGKILELPWDAEVLAQCTPLYESFKGWSQELPPSGRFADLPEETRAYIKGVERLIGAKVTMVGTGPHRENAVYC